MKIKFLFLFCLFLTACTLEQGFSEEVDFAVTLSPNQQPTVSPSPPPEVVVASEPPLANRMTLPPPSQTSLPLPSPTSKQLGTPTPTEFSEPTPPPTLLPISALEAINTHNVTDLQLLGGFAIPSVTARAYNPTDNILAIAQPGALELVNAETGVSLAILKGPTTTRIGPKQPPWVRFSPDGHLVAAHVNANLLDIWDTATGELVATISNDFSGFSSFTFSPDSKLVARGGLWDGEVSIYRSTGEFLYPLVGPARQIQSVSFSGDSQFFAAGSNFGKVRIWELSTGELVAEITDEFLDWVSAIAFSPDNQLLAIGLGGFFGDTSIFVYDLANQQIRYVLTGHSTRILEFVWVPETELLISASIDGTLKFWEITDGSELNSLISSSDWLLHLSLASDRSRIITVTPKGIIQFWGVPSK